MQQLLLLLPQNHFRVHLLYSLSAHIFPHLLYAIAILSSRAAQNMQIQIISAISVPLPFAFFLSLIRGELRFFIFILRNFVIVLLIYFIISFVPQPVAIFSFFSFKFSSNSILNKLNAYKYRLWKINAVWMRLLHRQWVDNFYLINSWAEFYVIGIRLLNRREVANSYRFILLWFCAMHSHVERSKNHQSADHFMLSWVKC